MFSDESTFRLVSGGSKFIRRTATVSRYDAKYTVKTVKHPDSVMVWGAFSGNKGRGGLYFLPKNVTMRAVHYISVLEEHLLNFWHIHECDFFMHDGAHKAKSVKKFLADHKINVLEWPGNTPDFNPIENAWNHMKNKVEESRPSNINVLKETLKTLWVHMDADYFKNLAESMPKRMQLVIDSKGDMTKY